MRSSPSLPTPLLVLLLSALPLPFVRAADIELKIESTTDVTCSRPTKPGDRISVHYRGTLQSTGAVFDESYTRGRPITFRLGSGQVIEGWDRGLRDMCPGEGRRLTIPPEMAYGEVGSPPVIPGGATLVFETTLVEIVGVKQEFVSTVSQATTSTATEETFSIATSPSEPPPSSEDSSKSEVDDDIPEFAAEPLTPPSSSSADEPEEPGQCHLLGPFALFVQGALGAVALLSLVYKRWRETPKRPWKIFFFDVSKQVVGSGLTHVLNLAMSMLGSVDMVHAAQNAGVNASADGDGGGGGSGGGGGERKTPNPCSFYLLNLGIDVSTPLPHMSPHTYTN